MGSNPVGDSDFTFVLCSWQLFISIDIGIFFFNYCFEFTSDAVSYGTVFEHFRKAFV